MSVSTSRSINYAIVFVYHFHYHFHYHYHFQCLRDSVFLYKGIRKSENSRLETAKFIAFVKKGR